jgi:ribonuclease HI
VSYSIYVDVSAPGNQSGCIRGGIGLAVYDEDNEVVYENGTVVDRPTNNAELELMALVEALEYAEDDDVIYSDSEYCVKGFNEWLDSWKRKGWRKSDKKPVANRALWKQIDELRSDKYVEVMKVRSHSSEGNELANELAVEALNDYK